MGKASFPPGGATIPGLGAEIWIKVHWVGKRPLTAPTVVAKMDEALAV
jgi:hypothetical protein